MAQIGLRAKSSSSPILFAAMDGATKVKLRIQEYPWEARAGRFPSLLDTRRGSACKTHLLRWLQSMSRGEEQGCFLTGTSGKVNTET